MPVPITVAKWTTWESNPETVGFEPTRYASSRQSSMSELPLRTACPYLSTPKELTRGRWKSRTPTQERIPKGSNLVAGQPCGTFHDGTLLPPTRHYSVTIEVGVRAAGRSRTYLPFD